PGGRAHSKVAALPLSRPIAVNLPLPARHLWLVGVLSFAAGALAGCTTPAAISRSRLEGPGAGFRFRDAAAEAGLIFHWGHGGRTPLNILETLGHGCAFLDYDGDGLPDIWLVGDQRSALY